MKKVNDTPKFIRGKYTPAQGKAAAKYVKEHYEDIKVRVPKGKKQKYTDYAKDKGISLNKFCVSSMDKVISEDTDSKILKNKADG